MKNKTPLILLAIIGIGLYLKTRPESDYTITDDHFSHQGKWINTEDFWDRLRNN